jgi:hypothetical protein
MEHGLFGCRASSQVLAPHPPLPFPGSCSLQNAGAAGTALIRSTFAAFADGHDAPAGADRPNPRDISNAVVFADDQPENERGMSTLVYIWGQVRVAWLCTRTSFHSWMCGSWLTIRILTATTHTRALTP